MTINQFIKNLLPWWVIEPIIYFKFFGKTIQNHELYIQRLVNKSGLEIGGPSTVFKRILPVYPCISSLDGVNFAHQTVWEGNISPETSFAYYANKKGKQYINDATALSQIADKSYDFLLSSNCIEHIANPIRALLEWKRVLKSEGVLVLVVPNKESNFDHKRNFTSIEHLIEDYENQTQESDLTHLDEILENHDLNRDPRAGSLISFQDRSLNNYSNRTLHHHVFNIETLSKILIYSGFEVLTSTTTREDFFVLARKIS